MESSTVEQEKELPATKPDARITESRSMPPARSSSRKFAILGALLVLAAIGAYLWVHSLNRVSTDDAQVDGHIVPISPKIYGKVLEVLVDDNQQVKRGQVLVRIDPQDYQAKVDQAQAAVAVAESHAQGANAGVPLIRDTTGSSVTAAEAQLSAAKADYDQARVESERAASADIAVARANVETAQATADHAQTDLIRMKTLADKEEISSLEYDSYASAVRVAASQLQAAKDKLDAVTKDADTKKAGLLSAEARIAQAQAGIGQAKAAQQQVPVRVADASSAMASIAQAHANLEAAKLDLSYTTIVAPVDGVVTKKSVEVGQVVQQGQGMLMLVPLQDVWVTANFKETQLADVRNGQKAEVQVDLSGQTYPGHVDSLAAATGTRMSLLPPENATGNYVKVVQRIPVKIMLDPIPGGNQVLRPGMNIEATIFTK
ncbi:MAG: HlyD family secretion protein [Bryobacteraceae bacterium]|jgi:membrane fusion protein (multidrug efflux system)